MAISETLSKSEDFRGFVKAVVEYIAESAERESAFLYPDPAWNVEVSGLLDFIVDNTGIPKEAVSAWVDAIADQKPEDVA